MFSFMEDTFGSIWSLSCLAYWCFDGFLGLETVHWGYRIHHFVVHQTSTLGHISPSRDCHIPHHFGYSFEVGFRVSPLRHWSILYSDFLADYCWAEDSWLMILDSSFGCALYIHTGAYSPFLRDSYLLLYTVRGWMIIVSLFTSRLRH